MIKISLKYSTSKKQEAAARTAIEYEILYNPNLNGSEFKIDEVILHVLTD